MDCELSAPAVLNPEDAGFCDAPPKVLEPFVEDEVLLVKLENGLVPLVGFPNEPPGCCKDPKGVKDGVDDCCCGFDRSFCDENEFTGGAFEVALDPNEAPKLVFEGGMDVAGAGLKLVLEKLEKPFCVVLVEVLFGTLEKELEDGAPAVKLAAGPDS